MPNRTNELVPLTQAQAMAQRLKAAGVDHQLDVFPGNRHALDFRADAWRPTLAYLEKHLAEPPASDDALPVALWALAVPIAAVAVALVVRRRARP